MVSAFFGGFFPFFAPVVMLIAVFAAPKGKRWMALLGFLIVFKGASCLINGEFPQSHHSAPPIQGPMATFGGLFLVTMGAYVLFTSFRKK